MCEVETVSESLKVYFLVDGSTVVKKKKTETLKTWLSKFSGARQVISETWKEVFSRRTLPYGTHYSIRLWFSLTEAGESLKRTDQLWKGMLNSHAKIDSPR